MPNLNDSYRELVEQCSPKDQDYGALSTIDQNLGLIIETAQSAGLDLRDPATLATVTSAMALATSWTLNHIATFCPEEDCAEAADQHVRVAMGQLGAHFVQLKKLIST